MPHNISESRRRPFYGVMNTNTNELVTEQRMTRTEARQAARSLSSQRGNDRHIPVRVQINRA